MRQPLSVIIPCKNEQHNISDCIASARQVADEVLIADSGSTDRTLLLARRSGPVRIIERHYVNSGNFKNWAIPQARHRWVLILDADERVTRPLAQEIRQRLSTEPAEDGYWIYRANYFMGRRVRFSGWQHDRVLRLFHRDRGRYQGEYDHAEVVIRSGRVGRLRHRLEHRTYESYDDYFERFQRYTTYQARRWHERGCRASVVRLALHMPARFLKSYLWQLGFLDGAVGLQIAMLSGFYSFMKQARLWELQQQQHAAERPDATEQQRQTGGPSPAPPHHTSADVA